MKPLRAAWARRMAPVLWLLFLAAGPLFVFPERRSVLILAVLPLLLALNFFVWRRMLPLTPLNGPLLLLAGMLLVSLWATSDLLASLPKISGLLYGLLGFFLMAETAKTPKGWAAGLVLYLLAGLGLTLLAIPGTDWLSKFFLIQWLTAHLPARLLSLPGAEQGFHSIEVAGALLWLLPLSVGAAWSALRSQFPFNFLRWRALWFALFALTALLEGGVLLLTQSRGAYLGLLAAGFLALLLAVQARFGWLGLAKAGLAALLAGGLLVFSYWEAISAALFSPAGFFAKNFFSLHSLNLRLVIWSRAIAGLKDFSLTGMGLNRFREVVYTLYPSIGLSYDNLGHAHNELLQAGLDLGLPGLAALIAIYMTAFWMLYQLFARGKPNNPSGLLLGLFAGLFSHFLFGLTDAVALGAKPGLLFWLLLGLLAGLYAQVFRPARPGRA